MKQAFVRKFTKRGGIVIHRRSFLFVALTGALVFAFVASAYATTFMAPTRARTFNWVTDYYTWGTPSGGGVAGAPGSVLLSEVGANPLNPGVHGGYLANTAKCGVCHSVHRARGDGVYLLDTNVATCAGCHMTGSTVTDVVINWQDSDPLETTNTGGPHRTGIPGDCLFRACHMSNPHGANGSEYAIIARALLNPFTDSLLTTAIANPTSSGISAALLDGVAGVSVCPTLGVSWPASTQSLVRTGYNCNICHSRTMLAVVRPGWAEDRHSVTATGVAGPLVSKTGHPGVAVGTTTTVAGGTGLSAFAPVSDCESCHDQTDTATRSGFTFPHGQEPVGNTNLRLADGVTMDDRRSLLWMGWSGGQGLPLQRIEMNLPEANSTMKAYDGNCLKCHRNTAGDAGVGMTW